MLYSRRLTTLLLAALMGFPGLRAQEEEPAKPETLLNLGYNLTRGTVDSMLLELGGQYTHPLDDHTFHLEAAYAYGQTEGNEGGEDITTRDTSNAKLRYDYLFDDPWFGYVEADVLRDELSEIDYRLTIGPGIGLHLIETDTLKLTTEIGAAWVAEKIDDETTGEIAARFGQQLKWVISPTATLTQSLDVLRKFNDEHEDLITTRITLDSSLTGNLSLRLDLKNRYESEPAEGTDSNNLTFTAGIAVKL